MIAIQGMKYTRNSHNWFRIRTIDEARGSVSAPELWPVRRAAAGWTTSTFGCWLPAGRARVSSAELARRFKLSAPGLQKRMKRLEAARRDSRVRHAGQPRPPWDSICSASSTSCSRTIVPGSVKRFPERIKALPEVLECHYLTGEVDYLLKVVVANHDHLEQFLFEKLMKVDGVDRIRTSIVLKEIKTSTSLPL